jgi:hypothetical protein
MAEENKEQSELSQEHNSEKEDNRLPYEPPKLRKHGKVNDTTLTRITPAPRIDAFFGPGRVDFS